MRRGKQTYFGIFSHVWAFPTGTHQSKNQGRTGARTVPDLIDPELADLGHVFGRRRIQSVLGDALAEDRVGQSNLGADA